MSLERDKFSNKGWNYANKNDSYKSVPVSKKLGSIGKVDHYAMGSQSARKNSNNDGSKDKEK